MTTERSPWGMTRTFFRPEPVGPDELCGGGGGVGKDERCAAIGRGVVRVGEGVPVIVLGEIVRGEDERRAARGASARSSAKSRAAQQVEAIAFSRVIGLRPVQVEQVAGLLAAAAG